jgi:hypothetical protein
MNPSTLQRPTSSTTNPRTRTPRTSTARALALLPIAGLLALSGSALGAPALDIRVPPVFGTGAGPGFDPNSTQGQWFLNNNGVAEVRTHEFYDNTPGNGGGGVGSLAIQGHLLQLLPGAPGMISGYVIRASITNNTPQLAGGWQPGRNLHQEFLPAPSTPYVGKMFDVKLTTHWADDGIQNNFNPAFPNVPSINPGNSVGESNTFGVNYDQLGWYCYNPNNAANPPGSFQVPTWDFGDIDVGQTVTRDLTFGFYNQVPALLFSTTLFNIQDFLIGRSNDLKIGAYLQNDPILNTIFDTGAPYPFGGLPGTVTAEYSNVSVFFNVPSPGALALLGLGGLLTARRRR